MKEKDWPVWIVIRQQDYEQDHIRGLFWSREEAVKFSDSRYDDIVEESISPRRVGQ